MTVVPCRDCGAPGDEAPDDPAPNLCPGCYKARLDRITPLFMRVVAEHEDPFLAIEWLEAALVNIGGETPAYARQHATELLFKALGR